MHWICYIYANDFRMKLSKYYFVFTTTAAAAAVAVEVLLATTAAAAQMRLAFFNASCRSAF